MIHAYDKTYLSNAQKVLSSMLDCMVNELKMALKDAWECFLMSEYSTKFEQGDCSVIVGMSGKELAYNIFNKNYIEEGPYDFNRSKEFWTGWSLAYYQWLTGLKFCEIEDFISIESIRDLYEPYHEMDIQQFVDKMNEMYEKSRHNTNIKSLRLMAGLSQSELAKLSDVPVRTIQQYEQRQKNINKAQVDTLFRLARVLNCKIEDLFEKIN